MDNAEKHNFHYTIGWDIDANGDPLNWSPVQNYGDTYDGFVTHGATIADINGNGSLDLILFGGDDAADPNMPGYIIGWDFDNSDSLIAPSLWSPVKDQYSVQDYIGAGAVTDLNNNGRPEMYVPRTGADGWRDAITSPIFFGVDLDNYGDQQRPPFSSGFFSMWAFTSWSGGNKSIGSGLDIADIDGNGKNDVLTTFILEGTNELAYIIGWDLRNDVATSEFEFGMASAWSYSPPFVVYGASGGIKGQLPSIPSIGGNITNVSVKIADVDGNGIPDWLLMCTDSEANQLHYMIGWNLNSNGEPESWSEIKTSPQIGGAAAGGGAVATDLNRNGKLDLLLLDLTP